MRAVPKSAKSSNTFHIVEDRKEALRGCDFVITTFSPGSMDAFHNDLKVPVKYGVRLPVSMTCGISGISASIRTVPVAYKITQDMEEVCPGVILVNVTNPMTAVTHAFRMVFALCGADTDTALTLSRKSFAVKTEALAGMHEFHREKAAAGVIECDINRD